MLNQLYIENIAVIEKVSLEFSTGLHVLTGETGAGKSMIIDALHLILGERASKDIIRNGEKRAFVSAEFGALSDNVISALNENGFEADDSLVIERAITSDGRNICKINGRPANVALLKQISPMLLNIHGQHENYTLLSPDLHVHYVDRFACLTSLIDEYSSSFKELVRIRSEIKKLREDESKKEERVDFLKFRIDELEKADIKIGERQELQERKAVLLNSEKIASALNTSISIFEGDDGESLQGMASSASREVNSALKFMPELSELSDRLENITYELSDIQSQLYQFMDNIKYEPGELEEIENRLDVLYKLSLKYESEEDMINQLALMQEELQSFDTAEERLKELTEQYEEVKEKSIALAKELSRKRKESCRFLEKSVTEQLDFLNMSNVRFSVNQERVPLNALGCDKIEFFIATNAGEELKPLAKIASGGELSRIMLAIKTVLSQHDGIDTLIFDEIDTGISGSAAEKVGLKLKELSKNKQVLCVTHLAQIAALADCHYKIFKQVIDGRTYTDVEMLDFEQRCNEVARIMGGTVVTELMVENAKQMIEQSNRQ